IWYERFGAPSGSPLMNRHSVLKLVRSRGEGAPLESITRPSSAARAASTAANTHIASNTPMPTGRLFTLRADSILEVMSLFLSVLVRREIYMAITHAPPPRLAAVSPLSRSRERV